MCLIDFSWLCRRHLNGSFESKFCMYIYNIIGFFPYSLLMSTLFCRRVYFLVLLSFLFSEPPPLLQVWFFLLFF